MEAEEVPSTECGLNLRSRRRKQLSEAQSVEGDNTSDGEAR